MTEQLNQAEQPKKSSTLLGIIVHAVSNWFDQRYFKMRQREVERGFATGVDEVVGSVAGAFSLFNTEYYGRDGSIDIDGIRKKIEDAKKR